MAQSGTPSNAVSELVEHFRLEAQSHHDCTHVYLPVRGRRGAKRREKWVNQRALGQGSFGIVWLEQKAGGETNDVRAVKEMRKGMGNLLAFNIDYARELYAMAKLTRHTDYFAEFYGWYENESSVFLSMEFFPHGDLEICVRGPLPGPEAQEIVHQLLSGLQVIHEYGITHRDLKPQNIFVVEKSPHWWVKLGDFGISKRIGGASTSLHTAIGTPLFMAPEVLDEDNLDGYTSAVDIWALGCVLYLLLAWTPPFDKKGVRQYAQGNLEFPVQALRDQGATSPAIDFTEGLLAAQAKDRPSAKAAMQLPWMSREAAGQRELTGTTLEERPGTGALSQEQPQGRPENRGISERIIPGDTPTLLSLTTLKNALPGAAQAERAAKSPAEAPPDRPSAMRPSAPPQSPRKVSTSSTINKVPLPHDSASFPSSPPPNSPDTIRPYKRGRNPARAAYQDREERPRAPRLSPEAPDRGIGSPSSSPTRRKGVFDRHREPSRRHSSPGSEDATETMYFEDRSDLSMSRPRRHSISPLPQRRKGFHTRNRSPVRGEDRDRTVRWGRSPPREKIQPRKEDSDSNPRPRGDDMWTEITKDLVLREAIEALGYQYEETTDFFYITMYLKYEDVLQLVELSDDIRKARRSQIRRRHDSDVPVSPFRAEHQPDRNRLERLSGAEADTREKTRRGKQYMGDNTVLYGT